MVADVELAVDAPEVEDGAATDDVSMLPIASELVLLESAAADALELLELLVADDDDPVTDSVTDETGCDFPSAIIVLWKTERLHTLTEIADPVAAALVAALVVKPTVRVELPDAADAELELALVLELESALELELAELEVEDALSELLDTDDPLLEPLGVSVLTHCFTSITCALPSDPVVGVSVIVHVSVTTPSGLQNR